MYFVIVSTWWSSRKRKNNKRKPSVINKHDDDDYWREKERGPIWLMDDRSVLFFNPSSRTMAMCQSREVLLDLTWRRSLSPHRVYISIGIAWGWQSKWLSICSIENKQSQESEREREKTGTRIELWRERERAQEKCHRCRRIRESFTRARIVVRSMRIERKPVRHAHRFRFTLCKCVDVIFSVTKDSLMILQRVPRLTAFER